MRCKEFLNEIKRNRWLYFMMLPGVICFFLFNYLPLAGIIVAFKNFNFSKGIFFSPWVGLENFKFFFNSNRWIIVTRNTVILNLLFIFVHTVLQVTFALLMNEIKTRWFKKLSQTITFLPYFVSWIVVSVFTYNLFNYEYGALNSFLTSIVKSKINIYSNPDIWPVIMTVIDCWKWAGYGMVIYLATITAISQDYYDAATIDGAGKLQQTRYISIPLLMPTVVMLTLLSIGRIFNSDFGMFYGIIGDNSALFSTMDVIDTFVYRSLRKLGDIGMASAIGFLQSIVGFCLIFGSNLLARKYQDDGALF